MDSAARVLELGDVGAGFRVTDVGSVDLAAKAPGDDDGLLGLVSGELLRQEERRGVVAAKAIGLEIHLGFHGCVLIGSDPVQQQVLLPVDGAGRHVQHEPGDVSAHLLEVLAACLLLRDPEGLVDVGRHDDSAVGADDAHDHDEAQEDRERLNADDGAEDSVGTALRAQIVLVLGEVHRVVFPRRFNRPCGGCATAVWRAAR